MEFLKTTVLAAVVLAFAGCGKDGNKSHKGGESDAPAPAPTPAAPADTNSKDPHLAPPSGATPAAGKTSAPEVQSDRSQSKMNPPSTAGMEDRSARVEGSFFTADGSPSSFEVHDKKPLVVMISAFSCGACAKEAKDLKGYLAAKHGGKVPGNVELMTILLSSEAEDAQSWQSHQGIPWLVGYQTDDAVITRYCQAMTTPCTLVRLPQKGIVLARNGIIAPEDLESLTGGWQ